MYKKEAIKRIAVAIGKIADAIDPTPTSATIERTPEDVRVAKLNEHRLQKFVEQRKEAGLRYQEKPSDPTLNWQKPKDEQPVTLLTGTV